MPCVIADLATEDAQSPMRRRFSSFMASMRRGSVSSSTGRDYRASCTSLNSLASQSSSPIALLSSPPPKSGKHKQKGMAGLIRASRRSSKQSSIIRQNGDIIIIKAGKIVSIRRQPGTPGGLRDSSPLIRRAFPAEADSVHGVHNSSELLRMGGGNGGGRPSNGHAKTGRGVDGGCGVDGGVSIDNNNTTVLSKAGSPHPQRRSSVSSVGSDNVFDDSFSHVLPSGDTQAESPLEMISEEKRLLSKHSDIDQVVETSVDFLDVATTDSWNGSRKDLRRGSGASAAAAVGNIHPETSSCGTDTKTTRHQTDVGIIISIDEDNSILNVAPLTPRTRDHINRSDLFLQDSGATALLAPRGMKLSQSTQGLCKRSLHRLPSVEHLDPPVRLKRSSSDFNVSNTSKAIKFLMPAPTSRRWSFGRNPKKDAEHV
ncbi:hypothetical protein V1264_013986 [Littorina saxatilis]|uniref:Uncharacterized protein n=1 Tax=Littorina saxatilis TaxID=31220 RepID=A0AAN9BR16_9CAEN